MDSPADRFTSLEPAHPAWEPAPRGTLSLSRRRLLQLGALSSAAVAISACAPTEQPSPVTSPAGSGGPSPASGPSEGPGSQGGTITYALVAEPDSLDPAATANASSHDVMFGLYDPLVWRNPDSAEFEPGLAESWEVSPDGLTYTFKLRAGVTFADGTPLTSEAIKFSFDRAIALKAPVAASKLGPYSGTTVVDDLTADVHLSTPFPALLDGLSQHWLAIVSPAAVGQHGDAFGRNPVGTGPFAFKEWATNDHITIVRNDGYDWGPRFLSNPGPAHVDEIVFRPVADNAARVTGLQTGEFDIIQGVPEANFSLLGDSGEFQLEVVEIPGGPFVMFINTESPALKDLAVRQAILHGIDRKAYVDAAVFGLYPEAFGPLAPNTQYYSKLVEARYPFDTNKSKSLLTEAGWAEGPDGVRIKDGQTLSLDYYTYPGWSIQATTVQGLLQPLGIQVKVIVNDVPTWFAASHNGEHDLTNTSFIDTEPSGIQLFYTSENYGGFNWSRVKDAEIDDLFARQAIAVDTDERRAIFEQIQMRIIDQAWICPLYQLTRLFAVNARVRGFRTNSLAYLFYGDLSVA